MQTNNHTTAKTQFSMVMTTCSIISAVLVVWIHAYNIGAYGDVSNPFVYWLEQGISQGLARGGVPFFFMSSAFFLYSRSKPVTDIYKSRAKSIVVPYLLWNTVYMVAFAVLYRLGLTGSGMKEITVGNILGGIFLHQYNYTFWFMLYLIAYIACYPIIRWVLERGKAVAVIGLVISLALFWSQIDILERFAYYYIGALIGFYYPSAAESVVGMKKKHIVGITSVLFVLETALFWMTNVLGFSSMMRLRDLVMAFLLFFLVVCFNLRITGKFASLSFVIYALHPLLLEMIENVLFLLLPQSALSLLIDYVAAPVVCLVIIFAVCMLWKKVLPSVYKVFNGGRL